MNLLINQTGNPLSQVVEAVRELGELGEWIKPERNSRSESRTDNNRVSRRDMFMALLKDGVSREEIDGVETKKLWEM